MNNSWLPPLRKIVVRGFNVAALLMLAIPFLFPFWWMLTSAFKTQTEIFEFPPPLTVIAIGEVVQP